MLTTLTFNLKNAPIRRETLHGREYIVAPMAMLTEGVHNGSGGALLYRAPELKKSTPAWNMRPIVVYHPKINGQGVSACDPVILERQQVGMVMNARWDGKLRAEAWIEAERAAVVDDRVVAALEGNQMMEVSTGLFTNNVGEPGEWEGEEYVAEATDHQPDHLALLPDQIGACSIADGAGLLQLNETAKAAGVDVTHILARQVDVMRRMVGNAMSHSNIYSALSRALRERLNLGKDRNVWIADVYDDFVVYEIEGDGKVTLFRLGYTANDATVALAEGDPDEVIRVTEYRTATGDFVGNEARNPHKENGMDKKQIVDGLIANAQTQWAEEDREALMALEEATLEKMAPVEAEGAPTPVQAAAEKGAEGVKPTAPAADTTENTVEGYIAKAPAAIREVLENSLATHKAEKEKLIEGIAANKANKFTKEFLGTKSLQELQGLAALAGTAAAATTPTRQNPPMFAGAATPAAAPTANAEEEGLALPTINFDQDPAPKA